MLQNYIKIALRNIFRYKSYASINIVGLALGVAIFFIAVQFTNYHYSWDKFHEKSEDVYRIHQKFNDGGTTATSSYPIKYALLDEYPEIQAATHFSRWGNTRVLIGDKKILGEEIFFIEPQFFDIFDIEFIKGTKNVAQESIKTNANLAIITQEYAELMFGEEAPIGKMFSLDRGGGVSVNFTVHSVIRELPENSHFHVNILIPLTSVSYYQSIENNWNNPSMFTYVHIPDKQKAKNFIKQGTLDKFIEKYFPPLYGGSEAHLPVIAMEDIHLHSALPFELATNSSLTLIRIVGSIGILILALASINFMNLTTAKATRRAKEVGMRKFLGATKDNLIKQFIGEAIIFSCLSVSFGIILAEFFLPQFNQYLNQNLKISYFDNWFTIAVIVLIVLGLGLISGMYPAFILSAFKPIEALKDAKGNMKTTSGFLVRKGLVILQFMVVAVLLVTIFTMQDQLNFLANKDLGYNNKNLVFIRNSDRIIENPANYQLFVNELRNSGKIESVAGYSWWNYHAIEFEGMKPNERIGTRVDIADAEYASMLGLNLVAGRLASSETITDKSAIVFNEAAITVFGWNAEEAIGKEIKLNEGDSTYEIIGVYEDYHFEDFTAKISPQGIITSPTERFPNTIIRLPQDNREPALDLITKAWNRFDDGWPLEILDNEQQLESSMAEIVNLQSIMSRLTYLGIFIACLGLYGLTAFSTERRIKEIGIRKVLGASIKSIWSLIIAEFIILVSIATAVGVIIGFFAGDYILENYAYRISIGPKIFISSATIAIFIAVITVSYQGLRAAFLNPIESLQVE
ncbi:MAG: FtsX-like permease family protein [Bacteroidota bacterium]